MFGANNYDQWKLAKWERETGDSDEEFEIDIYWDLRKYVRENLVSEVKIEETENGVCVTLGIPENDDLWLDIDFNTLERDLKNKFKIKSLKKK